MIRRIGIVTSLFLAVCFLVAFIAIILDWPMTSDEGVRAAIMCLGGVVGFVMVALSLGGVFEVAPDSRPIE